MSYTNRVPGVKRFNAIFAPTQMSLAMAQAGIIPGTHLKRELATTALLRHPHDRRNVRPSSFVAF